MSKFKYLKTVKILLFYFVIIFSAINLFFVAKNLAANKPHGIISSSVKELAFPKGSRKKFDSIGYYLTNDVIVDRGSNEYYLSYFLAQYIASPFFLEKLDNQELVLSDCFSKCPEIITNNYKKITSNGTFNLFQHNK